VIAGDYHFVLELKFAEPSVEGAERRRPRKMSTVSGVYQQVAVRDDEFIVEFVGVAEADDAH
jgi:hypothetical protein